MNPETEAKLARITELLAQRDDINQRLNAILTAQPESGPEPKPARKAATRRPTNKGRKIASPPRIAKRNYRREDVEHDILAGEKAASIAEKYGIEASTVYQIKHEMRKSGTLSPNPIRRKDQISLTVATPKPASRRGRPRKESVIQHAKR